MKKRILLHRNKLNKGFTLVELILTLAVIAAISFMSFQSMNRDLESQQAASAGEQIRNVGTGVNNYIVNHYDVLSKLENSTGGTQDLGPRICTTATQTCEITTQTLVNEGMLPPVFNGKNIYGSGYKIIISRKGSAPYWNISALVATDTTLSRSGSIRYDLLGKAMQTAGIDSGMTRTASNKVDGYKGSWSATQTEFSNINKQGLLAYIAGYGSNSYSAFLRRDGTLPMTGDLNMGTKNIYGAANITASGKGTFGGEVEAGSWIKAKNGYGDVISIGGDAATNDYEMVLGSDKPLTIYGAVAPVQINVNGSLKTSLDLNADRDVNAGNWLTAKNLNGDKLMIGGDGTGDYDIVFAPTKSGNNVVGFFSAGSATPFDFNFRGNINALNAGGTQRGVAMNGTTGDIVASGNITASKTVYGQYLKANQVVTAGATCGEIGLLARDNVGQVLSCVSGVWQPEQPVGTPLPWPSTTPPAGWLICNGQTFNTAQYPLLAKAYPGGKLPDLRGSFIRGLDQGRGIDGGRAILSEQRASVVTGTDDNWASSDIGALHGPSSAYSRDAINVYDYTTGSNGQDPKYYMQYSTSASGPSLGHNEAITSGVVAVNNGSNGFYGGARPYNTAFVYIVRAL